MGYEMSTRLLSLIIFIFLFFIGALYLLYLQLLYPTLIPGYGGGERFSLIKANNYTFQIPWFAYSRLHLTLQANDTVKLYLDDQYVCNCSQHDIVIEPGEEALVVLKSGSSVSGMFTARQEIPLERQILASSVLLVGLIGTILILTKYRVIPQLYEDSNVRA
jgi:hypothetical protein